MQEIENSRLARTFFRLALVPPALLLISCAGKTTTRATPFFAVTPTRQATNAIDAGDGDLEIASLRKTVTENPNDVDSRLRLAQAYSAHGFPDVALEHLRLASERFPDSQSAALRLARVLRQSGQKEEALKGLKVFVHNHPQNTAEAYEWLGILNDDLHSWKESQLAYETALLYSPASPELHNNLGYSLLMQHLNNAAATEFRTSLRLDRNSVIARNNLGIALAENPDGNHSEAILNWQAAGGPAVAHNNMAALLIERGDLAGARKELETALSYDRQNGPAIYNLALVAERDGKPAVLQAPEAKTAKQRSALARFFHYLRDDSHAGGQSPASGKPAGQPPVVQTAGPVAVPAGSGSGN